MFTWITWLGLLSCPAIAGELLVENRCLAVRLGDDGRLSVCDRRTGVTWSQVDVPIPGVTISTPRTVSPRCDAARRTLSWTAVLPGIRKENARADSWQPAEFAMELTLDPEQPDVRLTYVPKVQGEWREVFDTRCFALASDDACLVFPHCEGALLPLRPGPIRLPKDNIHAGYGPYCACLGMVRMDAGDGLLVAFETPESALYEMADVTVGGKPTSLPRLSWRADKLHLDRPLAVTFTFSDRGGYVALAQQYRRHFRRWGFARTLRDKQAANPAVERLVGGAVYWISGPADEVLAVARMMHADGIDRAVIEIAAPYWHCPGRYQPELKAMEAAVPEIRNLGYVVSHYDQYRDAFARDDRALSYNQMNTALYPDGIVRQEDGQLRRGWPPGFVINPRVALELASRQIPADLKRFPFDGRFLDCVGTCPFWEGEDWDPRHPLDARGTRDARVELLRNANRNGLMVGTEGGIDSYLPNLHWLETPMSLVRWTVGSLPLPGYDPVPLKPDYRINIDTTYRIPFYSLVHHEEIVSTWRWEDGFSRTPQYWQDKNLWSVLYGNVPMFFLDRAHYEKYREPIAQTHRYVCLWARKVAFEEMSSHRFVTPDWRVQETRFSNHHGVVVNFGKDAHRLEDGQVVPGRSYRTFIEGSAKKRTYSPPPVADLGERELTAQKGPE